MPGEHSKVRLRAVLRHSQRRHRILVLAGEVKGGTAGDEHLQPRRRREQLGDDRRGGVDVLEVVEHEQQRRWTEGLLQRLHAGADSERLGDRADDERGIGERGEIDEDRVVELGEKLSRRLDREPRLARPARPRERQQADVIGAQARSDGRQLEAATDEPRRRHRQARTGLSGGPGRR